MKIPILLVIYFCFITCNNDKSGSRKQVTSTDTFFKSDIPIDLYGENVAFEYVKKLEIKVGLKPIAKGFDSIQIRIWNVYEIPVGNSWDAGVQLLTLSIENNQWQGKYYKISFREKDKVVDTIVSMQTVRPNDGWNNLISSLRKMRLWTLPQMAEISDPKITFVLSKPVVVEIAERKLYRIYEYVNISEFINTSADAAEMNEILKFVEREFDLKWL